ncbi:hypothetical protein [Alcanivorax sp.]|jgi:spermidine synthase|uniref:hypothetical protein n=1 Tax=Alcanivorax sp. TaxID=1872427 RepID=UPI0032D90682
MHRPSRRDWAYRYASIRRCWWNRALAGKNTEVSEFRETNTTGKGLMRGIIQRRFIRALVMPPFMEAAIKR